MKKFFVTLVVFVGALAATTTTNAQAAKYGVFDIDLMVQAMPQYRAVDSLVQLYERDSLQREYDFYQGEFKRLDSTYKADSARKAPKSVLDQILNQRQQIGINLVYWQQISQNRIEQKRGTLAQPIFEKVLPAYKKVLDARKYDLVLKPNTFELGSKVENVFIFVAKELKVTLPQELGGGQEPQEEEKPAPAKAAPATKPAPKKN